MAHYLTQLRGLLWRNFLLKRRGWRHTLLEVAVPVVLVAVMVLISIDVRLNTTDSVDEFPAHNLSLSTFARPPTSRSPSAYSMIASPNLQFTSDVMQRVTDLLGLTPAKLATDGVNVTSSQIDSEYRRQGRSRTEVGVEFLWRETTEGHQVEGYVIRVPHRLFRDVSADCSYRKSMERCGKNRRGLSRDCPGNQALSSRLLSIQWSLETALIQTFLNESFQPPALQVQMMPMPAYRPGTTNYQLLICLSMVIALTPLVFCVTSALVTEKKTWTKAMLNGLGVKDSAFWISWWLVYAVVAALVGVAATVLVAVGGFFGSSGLGFFFLLVLLYGLSLVGLAFCVAAFFSTAKIGGLTASLLSLLLGLLYLAVAMTRPMTFTFDSERKMTESALTFVGQLVLSFFSPMAFALGLDQLVFDHEERVDSSITAGPFPLMMSLLMLAADAVLYFLLALYLHRVVPSKFHVSQKPWFFCLPSFWRAGSDENNDLTSVDTPHGPNMEPISEELEKYRAIRIRDLSKDFGDTCKEYEYGLNGLDLDVYEGQVTCILGHPGAGKTALVNILAGSIPPTSGAAFVYDLNTSNARDHSDLTSTVSLCPQRDVISGHLSVQEHLDIAAVLRGFSADTIEEQVSSCLTVVHLENQRDVRARELNGCQKRRLSLALALLADSKVLLLDEPTLGMSPEETRHVWHLLHSLKRGRAIILTTRHMDEAEFVADRTVVLSRGRLRCVGSAIFLRNEFRVGYHVDVTLRPASSTERLMKMVRSHVRGAILLRSEDDKHTISIPPNLNAKLTALFKKLESKDKGTDYLGITHISVSMTTLEEVFFKMENRDFVAEAQEEDAGNVFISPLLTPADDTFGDYDGDRLPEAQHHPRGSSVFPPPAPIRRSATTAQMDSVPRRYSAFPTQGVLRKDSDGGSNRRKSALDRVQMRHGSVSGGDAGGGHGQGHGHGHLSGALTRRISNIFAKTSSNPPRRSSSTSDFVADPLSNGRKSSSVLQRFHKDRSKSVAAGSLKKSASQQQFDAEVELEEGLAWRPDVLGTTSGGLPASLAARRATVAAYKDFRHSMSIHAGMASFGEDACFPISDPMGKMNLYGNVAEVKKRTSSDRSTGGIPSVSSYVDLEETSFTTVDKNHNNGKDAELASSASPPKIGEVLANLKLQEPGAKLELLRFGAMLRLRFQVCTRDTRALVLRFLIPLVVTALAIGLSYGTTYLNPPDPPLDGQRTHLFGINRVVYRNQSDGHLRDLLPLLARPLGGTEHLVEYTSQHLWDPSVSLESLLGVMQSDGSAYRLYYNATCALALPHLASYVSHVLRAVPENSPVHPDNQAYLAPRLSAYLAPWPVIERPDYITTDNWVTVLFLGLALILTPSYYAVNMLTERQKHIRRYLGVAGVSRLAYYASAFIVDVIDFFIPAAIVVVMSILSQIPMFQHEGAMECLGLLVILDLPVAVLFAYVVSFAFRRPQTCLVLMPILLALGAVSSYFLVRGLDVGATEQTATTLHYVLCVLWPPYIRFAGLHYIAKVSVEGKGGNPAASVFFEFDSSVDICFIMLVIDIVVLSCVVLVLDKLTFRPSPPPCARKPLLARPRHQVDESIHREMQLISNLKQGSDQSTRWPWLVVDGLTKALRRDDQRQVTAVSGATFTLSKGDVMGLLGPNDAGKSTLLQALLGLSAASDGEVYVGSRQMDTGNARQVCSQMGYCPQDNPLWDYLSVDQHVDLMAGLRGIGKDDLGLFRDSLYHDLDLEPYRHQRMYELLESEKRKLCFAMSMLGTQSMMILDEPSLGMDPTSRKNYWDAVKYFLKGSERSAIISTRCVEEAQFLCSRLAVMVNGQLRCLGSQDELRERCEKTFVLDMSLRGWEPERGPQRMEMLTLFLRELFPKLKVTKQFNERAVFTIICDDPDFSLAGTFDTLESLKRNLDVEDFTFSQFTLEHLYLELARDQIKGESRFTKLADIRVQNSAARGNPTQNHEDLPKEETEAAEVTSVAVAVDELSATESAADDSAEEPAPEEEPTRDPAAHTTSAASRDVDTEDVASSRKAAGDDADEAHVGAVIVHQHEGVSGGVDKPLVGANGGTDAPVAFNLHTGIDNASYVADEDEEETERNSTSL